MSLISGVEIRRLCKERVIIIETKDPTRPFDLDAQVTEDAIDLRISNVGKVIRKGIENLDIFHPNEGAFEEILIPESGYILKHGQVLYTNTLEAIKLPPNLAGRVSARSTFARMGLSVHCTHPKLAVGHDQSIPLQLINHNTIDLIIYPFSPIVQLQIEEVQGITVPYAGKYRGERELRGPIITSRDRDISTPTTRTSNLVRLGESAYLVLIQREIEHYRHELISMIRRIREEKGDKAQITESDIKMVKIPKRRIDIMEWLLGGTGFLLLGWSISIIVEGQLDYWRVVSLILSILFGLTLIGIALVLQYHE
jgi:dCTP deaminase